MSSMFNFFGMAGNYDERKVARLDADWGFISTARVTDADQSYETAIEHPEYNDGKMVIVEGYDTKQQALDGHDRWVAVMTAKTLPDRLVDRGSAGIAQMIDAFSPDGEQWRVFPRKVKEQ